MNGGRSLLPHTPRQWEMKKGAFRGTQREASSRDLGEISPAGWGKKPAKKTAAMTPKRFAQNSNFQQQDGIMKNANRHRQTRVQSHPRNNKNLCARKRACMGRREKRKIKPGRGSENNTTEFRIFRPWISAEGTIKKYAHDTSPHQHRLPLAATPYFQRKQRNSEAQRKVFRKIFNLMEGNRSHRMLSSVFLAGAGARGGGEKLCYNFL